LFIITYISDVLTCHSLHLDKLQNYRSFTHKVLIYKSIFQPSDDSDMMKRDEGVDTFTLLHHDLNVCSNHV